MTLMCHQKCVTTIGAIAKKTHVGNFLEPLRCSLKLLKYKSVGGRIILKIVIKSLNQVTRDNFNGKNSNP